MDAKTKRKWVAAAFIGAACAGLLVGLLLQRNAYVNREQRCEKLYADAWKLFEKNKIEDGALALNVLFTSMPSCELAADAGYFSGVIKEFYTRETQKAVEIFRTVADRYPETPAAKKALEKITIYDTDDYSWYKDRVKEKRSPFLEKTDAEQMRELYEIYGDKLDQTIVHAGFLQDGARALKDNEKKNEYAYVKAVLLKAAGKLKSAKTIFTRLQEDTHPAPLQQKALLHLADISFRKKDYKSAMDALSGVTDVNLVPLADYGRAEIYFAQKEVSKAGEFYRRAQTAKIALADDALLFPFEPEASDYPQPAWFSGMDAALRGFQCDFLTDKKGDAAQAGAALPAIKMTLAKEYTKTRGNFLYRKQALYAYLLGASNEKLLRFKDALKNYAFVLEKGKPVQDPDAIFPEVLFSSARLYFQQKNYGKAQQLLTQFEEAYPENENVTDAKAYRLLSLEKSGKAGGTVATVESFIESVKDSGLSFALYYASVQKRQQAEKEELPSVRDLAEETQAKRFHETVMKKVLSGAVKTPDTLVKIGDISYYAGDTDNAMTYFKDALQRKNASGVKEGFQAIQTFSKKPDTLAAYLKKCVQKEKVRALEKKIEAQDSAALRMELAQAYAELGWTETAFSQWKQATLMDLQQVSPAYEENLKTRLRSLIEDVDSLFMENTFLSEGAALEKETARAFYERLLFSEMALRAGLEGRFPTRRGQMEKMVGEAVSQRLWNEFLKEKHFFIPTSEDLRALQEGLVDMLHSFRGNETVTAELLNALKSQCEEALSQLQEAEE